MKSGGRPYPAARWAFGAMFALSTCFFCLFLSLSVTLGSTPPDPDASPGFDGASIVVLASLLTSITSLLGFVSTSIIGWRKEKREAEEADRERQRHELELEKLRLELETMKREDDGA